MRGVLHEWTVPVVRAACFRRCAALKPEAVRQRQTMHAAAAPAPAPEGEHPGWQFFRSMGSPKYHVAPMVREHAA